MNPDFFIFLYMKYLLRLVLKIILFLFWLWWAIFYPFCKLLKFIWDFKWDKTYSWEKHYITLLDDKMWEAGYNKMSLFLALKFMLSDDFIDLLY